MDASSVDPTHKTDPPDPVEDNACKEDLKPTNENGTISNAVSTSENIDNNEENIVESVEHEGDADDTEHSSSSDTEHSSSNDTEHSSSSDTEHSSSSDSEHSERDFVYEGGFFVDYKKLYEEALYKLSELCKDQTTTGVVNEEQEIAINALEDKLREKEVELTILRNSSLTDKRSLDKDDNKGCTPDSCLSDNDEYKLECSSCTRLVHYHCTRLPLYQIQHFMTRNDRKYICSYCTNTQDYLRIIFSDHRRSTLINDNDASDHLDNEKITKLQKELDKKEGDLANLNDQMELARSHGNNNITLIHEREKTIDEMQEKINEIEHLDGMDKMFHQLESKLENLIERKLDEKMVKNPSYKRSNPITIASNKS